MWVVGARAGVHSARLNGKQKGVSCDATPTRTALPPQRSAIESPGSSRHLRLCSLPLDLKQIWEGLTGCNRPARIPANEGQVCLRRSGRFAHSLRGRRQGTCLLIPIMFSLNSVRVAPGARSALAVACGVALSAFHVGAQAEDAVAPVVVAPVVVAPVMVAGEQGPVLRDPRLEELMAAHRQAGGMSALQMPAGFLRNAAFDLPEGQR